MQSNKRLKHTIVQLLDAGLAVTPAGAPTARAPEPVRLKGCGPLTIDDIETAIAAGRDSAYVHPRRR